MIFKSEFLQFFVTLGVFLTFCVFWWSAKHHKIFFYQTLTAQNCTGLYNFIFSRYKWFIIALLRIDIELFILIVAGWDYTSCAYDDTCARWCIKLYMQSMEGGCATALSATTADLMCHDYGRIFNGLGANCADPLNCPYEQSLRGECYPNPGPCTNPNGCDIVSPCSTP